MKRMLHDSERKSAKTVADSEPKLGAPTTFSFGAPYEFTPSIGSRPNPEAIQASGFGPNSYSNEPKPQAASGIDAISKLWRPLT